MTGLCVSCCERTGDHRQPRVLSSLDTGGSLVAAVLPFDVRQDVPRSPQPEDLIPALRFVEPSLRGSSGRSAVQQQDHTTRLGVTATLVNINTEWDDVSWLSHNSVLQDSTAGNTTGNITVLLLVFPFLMSQRVCTQYCTVGQSTDVYMKADW